MQNRPTYAIESVDRALRVAALLQQEGSARVTYIAQALAISNSGAHRLLAMLVYRGFAEQLPDRSYAPGPVLRVAEPSDAPVQLLRQVGPPRLRMLVEQLGESANLMIRVGTETRFISTIESDRALRVGDRAGRSLPAHLTSGGRALLAFLSPDELARVFAGTAVDTTRLHRSLDRVRIDGYALNRGETEGGVTAVGVAVSSEHRRPVCAISVGMPTARFAKTMIPRLLDALTATREALERDIGSARRDPR